MFDIWRLNLCNRFLPGLWHFVPCWTPQAPQWQFWCAQMVPTDHPGCVPHKSNRIQDSERFSHLDHPMPLVARFAWFMVFLGHFWPLRTPHWQFWWVQNVLTDHPVCVPSISSWDFLRSNQLVPKWSKMTSNSPKCPKMAPNAPKWSKWPRMTINEVI